MLSIRGHLGNINGKKLNDEIDFSGPLHSDGTINLAILVGDSRLGKRSVFEFDIELAVERLNTASRLTSAISSALFALMSGASTGETPTVL
jgi:hypothetical protein